MTTGDTDELVQLNDPCLEPLFHVRGDGVDEEIARLIFDRVRPLARAILSRYCRTAAVLSPSDAEDIGSIVNLRIIAKLRETATSPEHAIREFDRYVATLTFNAINDYLRKAFPARARLKNRLRYAIIHERRLALWTSEGEVVCGLREWTGTRGLMADLQSLDMVEWPPDAEGARLAGALVHLFRQLARPLAFDVLVSFVAEASHLSETAQLAAAIPPIAPTEFDHEMREYLRALWREIADLRPVQRRALLLNLRSGDTTHLLAVIVLGGIAPIDDVAAALEMTAEKLAAIWNELPFDDLRIAEMLNVTRQQVINLRKSARERLARRMERNPGKT